MTQGKKHYGTPTEFGFCIKVGMSLLGWGPGVPVLPCAFPCQGISAPPQSHPRLPHDGSGLSPQPYKVRSGVKGLKLLCSEDEQSRSCWMAAFRLFKVSPGPAGVLPAPRQGNAGGMLGGCSHPCAGGCWGDARIPVLGDAGGMSPSLC